MVRVATFGSGALRSQCGSRFLPNQLRLQRVVAMRQLRIGGLHGRRPAPSTTSGSTRFARWRAVGDVGEAAPAVGNLLVLGERVGDQREGAQVFLEGLGERVRRCLAGIGLRVLHQVERRLDRQRFAFHLEAQARDGFVEQPVPRRIGRHRLLVEQLLDAVLELIRLVLADVLDPRPVVPERGVRHRGFELLVVEPVELELEEQQMDRGRRDALLHVAVEFRARRIDGVAGMHEAGERADPAEQIVERLVALHRLGERRSGVGPIRNASRACPCSHARTQGSRHRRDRGRASHPDRRSRRRGRRDSIPAACRALDFAADLAAGFDEDLAGLRAMARLADAGMIFNGLWMIHALSTAGVATPRPGRRPGHFVRHDQRMTSGAPAEGISRASCEQLHRQAAPRSAERRQSRTRTRHDQACEAGGEPASPCWAFASSRFS